MIRNLRVGQGVETGLKYSKLGDGGCARGRIDKRVLCLQLSLCIHMNSDAAATFVPFAAVLRHFAARQRP